MSPTVFYGLTYKEARLALEGYEKEQKQLYYYNYYATLNAIGQCLGGKKFEYIDIFEEDKNDKNNKNRITQEERQQILDMFSEMEK